MGSSIQGGFVRSYYKDDTYKGDEIYLSDRAKARQKYDNAYGASKEELVAEYGPFAASITRDDMNEWLERSRRRFSSPFTLGVEQAPYGTPKEVYDARVQFLRERIHEKIASLPKDGFRSNNSPVSERALPPTRPLNSSRSVRVKRDTETIRVPFDLRRQLEARGQYVKELRLMKEIDAEARQTSLAILNHSEGNSAFRRVKSTYPEFDPRMALTIPPRLIDRVIHRTNQALMTVVRHLPFSRRIEGRMSERLRDSYARTVGLEEFMLAQSGLGGSDRLGQLPNR